VGGADQSGAGVVVPAVAEQPAAQGFRWRGWVGGLLGQGAGEHRPVCAQWTEYGLEVLVWLASRAVVLFGQLAGVVGVVGEPGDGEVDDDRTGALAELQTARRIAAQQTRHHPMVRETTAVLISQHRRSHLLSPTTPTGLASRCSQRPPAPGSTLKRVLERSPTHRASGRVGRPGTPTQPGTVPGPFILPNHWPALCGWSEQGVAHPQGPVAGRAELGEFVVTSMAPKKLMFSLCAGEMWARTSSSMRRPGFDGQAVVLGGPGDHRVGDHGQAPGLLGLLLEVPGPDRAFVAVEQVAFEGVQRFALVELAGDLPPIRRIRQVRG
jgi:hypothetical protein